MPSDVNHAAEAASLFSRLQDQITNELEIVDGSGRFREDVWTREGGGGGRSRILTDGAVFEKAGVNFSEVFGEMSEEFARQVPGRGREFRATGISLVLHPRSPKVPTVHANFRYLIKGDKEWFGGGSDLTPYYPSLEDVVHFHRVWQHVCQKHAPLANHAKFKKWCDDYFFLPHRNEARGVGGIFFDYLEGNWDQLMAFIQDCGVHFLEAYLPIVRRRRHEAYSDKERVFQEYRRGRYVEFNLLHDRGTLFGLKTGGRIESILMSLPPVVRWIYDFQVEPDSPEDRLVKCFLIPKDWAQSGSE